MVYMIVKVQLLLIYRCFLWMFVWVLIHLKGKVLYVKILYIYIYIEYEFFCFWLMFVSSGNNIYNIVS